MIRIPKREWKTRRKRSTTVASTEAASNRNNLKIARRHNWRPPRYSENYGPSEAKVLLVIFQNDVISFCKTCPKCNKYHRVKLKRQGPLRPVLAGSPNERYYIDTTGPHRRSDRGNTYVLTCIDAFIKWGEAFPIRNREAETVAMVLVEQVFLRFGAPASVLIATKAKRSTET